VIVFLLAPAPIKHRILSVTDLSVNSTQVRLTQWRNAVKIFKDYPVTGLGWIDLNEIHRAYAPPGADLNYQAYWIGHFHNNLVMFLVYFGVIGFLAGVYMIFKLIQTEYRIYRSIPENKPHLSAWVAGSLAAMAGFWINGMFDWTFGDAEPVTLLWFTVGLSLAVTRIEANE
jgi:O-antigen ligase